MKIRATHFCLMLGLAACCGPLYAADAPAAEPSLFSAAPAPAVEPVPAFAASTPAPANPHTARAAAIVGDQVVSSTDLEDRMRLVLLTTGLADTQEVRQKLKPQVLHMLVDESLQMQEGARNGITVSEGDIQQAVALLEQRSGRPPGSLVQDLDAHGVPKLPFYAQMRAQLSWTKLVLKKIRPRIHVSDEEIARATRKTVDAPQTSEIQISTIRLPVDSPAAEPAAKALAEKLAGELRGGASFDAVAQQFATTGGAQELNEVWVEEAQIDPLIAKAVHDVQPGNIADPVKTQSGYQIVKLLARRQAGAAADTTSMVPEAELAIRQITLTLKPDAQPQEAGLMLNIARDLAKHAGSCFDKNVAGVENLSDTDIKVSYLRQKLSKLPPDLQRVIGPLEVGGISDPFASPEGIQLYMLCERIDLPPLPAPVDEAEKDRVRQQLFSEKIDLEAQKYMRNLRRDTFIDVRP